MADLTLTDELRDLHSQARAVAANAYAPYSHFAVGAALLADDGSVHTGVNVENASFGLAICAERSAVVSAISQGIRRFRAIAIHVEGPDGQPCGACRQFLAEFGLDLAVVHKQEGELVVRGLAELLPNAFIAAALPPQ